MSHNEIGDVLSAQGNLPAALDTFKASLAISDRLAAADPGNAGWQRDLAISEGRVGMMHDAGPDGQARCGARRFVARPGNHLTVAGAVSDDAVLATDIAWFDHQITEVEKINLRA